MSDVDAILASGSYAGRRGRRWGHVGLAGLWVLWADPSRVRLTPAQMKRLIERDLHRAECPGLAKCEPHPSPMIWRAAKGRWGHGTGWAVNEYPTFAEATAAAHNTTGDTK